MMDYENNPKNSHENRKQKKQNEKLIKIKSQHEILKKDKEMVEQQHEIKQK